MLRDTGNITSPHRGKMKSAVAGQNTNRSGESSDEFRPATEENSTMKTNRTKKMKSALELSFYELSWSKYPSDKL